MEGEHPGQIEKSEKHASPRLSVNIEDIPPFGLTLLYALQHYITMFGATVTYPYLMSSKMCLRSDDPARGYIISTTLFVSGITTILQSTFGTRLPIVQGTCYAFLAPTLALLSMPEWQCPPEYFAKYKSSANESSSNLTEDEWTDIWQVRIREVQGGLLVGSLAECLVGLTGTVGWFMSWVGPVTAAPVIMLLGLSIIRETADSISSNLPMAALTVFLMVLFTQHMENLTIPFPGWTRKRGLKIIRISIFKTLPVLVCVLITWLLCVILTSSGVLSEDSGIRTDSNMRALHDSSWIRVPYPGQWGAPTISNAGVILGFVAGALCSVLESVSDYFTCARLSDAPAPPAHALNRGILFEGLGGFLASFFGSGTALTSYSCNIAAISITKVASRRVVQVCGVLTLVLGVVGKMGALFSIMPQPVMGGLLAFMCFVIVGVGLELVQFLDLGKPRNAFIVGGALFWGLCLPAYVGAYPGDIATGVLSVDQTLSVLLSTPLFVAGVFALVLDNTIPATRTERGIDAWLDACSSTHTTREAVNAEAVMKKTSPYDFPYGMDWMRRRKWTTRVPFLPMFKRASEVILV